MSIAAPRLKTFDSFIFLLYLAFFVGLIFSFRAVSSISVGLLIVAGFVRNKIAGGRLFHHNLVNPFLFVCFLFYLLQLAAMLYTHDSDKGWVNVTLKSGLVLIPAAVLCSGYITETTRKRLVAWFCLLLATASLYCLGMAFIDPPDDPYISPFFYHTLVSPLHHHAVYFSILVFIALVFLLEGLRNNNPAWGHGIDILLAVFFSGFLLLLSSKLVIAFYFLYLVSFFTSLIRRRMLSRTVVAGLIAVSVISISLVFITRNPISNRFREIMSSDIAVVTKEKNVPSDYFNGLQFRLLQWKLVKSILNQNDCWWTGVSAGDAQEDLNQQYIARNMYQGDPASGRRGYLGYNTHNQFLESLLQNGIPGLVVFINICFMLVRMMLERKNRVLSFITLLLLAWSFSESAFETQYGILLFTFFPLFFWLDDNLFGSVSD